MITKLSFAAILALLFFSGCTRTTTLSIFTEYVSLESLPSYRIGTPDPALYCPDIGEKLHVYWSIAENISYESLKLHLQLRFGNRKEQEIWLDLLMPTGTYIYPLMNQDYWDKQGIFTFKAELYSDECLIKEWRHQLWAPYLHIGENLPVR